MNFSAQFKTVEKREAIDCEAYACAAEEVEALLTHLRDDHNFSMLVDLTAVDNGVDADPRFTAVYHVLNFETSSYVRIYSDCTGGDVPEIPSVSSVYSAANWHERETFDMFGIRFVGHPDLRRILMWDEYPHFPLRKDFPLAGIDTPYPEEDVVERTELSVKAAPMAGGPFVASNSGPVSSSEPRAKDQSWTELNPKHKD